VLCFYGDSNFLWSKYKSETFYKLSSCVSTLSNKRRTWKLKILALNRSFTVYYLHKSYWKWKILHTSVFSRILRTKPVIRGDHSNQVCRVEWTFPSMSVVIQQSASNNKSNQWSVSVSQHIIIPWNRHIVDPVRLYIHCHCDRASS